MTEKEMQTLSRADLLSILQEQRAEIEMLQKKLSAAEAALRQKPMIVNQAEVAADISVMSYSVFTAARNTDPSRAQSISETNIADEFPALLSKRIVIRTIPTFSITVDGAALHIGRAKSRELFALLVDRGERGITTGEGIAYLWPDRPNDANTQSLFRMTYKRLADALIEAGIGHIIASREKRRFIRVDQVDCDLYWILAGDMQTARQYDGQYMQEYSWAEDRNGQLYRMLLLK